MRATRCAVSWRVVIVLGVDHERMQQRLDLLRDLARERLELARLDAGGDVVVGPVLQPRGGEARADAIGNRGHGVSLGFSAAGLSVAFSMPDGLIGGRGGKPFKRRISSFNDWISSFAAASAAFSFSSSFRTPSISPINWRTSLTSSVGLNSLGESFKPGDTPGLNQASTQRSVNARESAPVTTKLSQIHCQRCRACETGLPWRRASQSADRGGARQGYGSFPG